MLSDIMRICCNTKANDSHAPDCTDPIEPVPEQQKEQGVDIEVPEEDD